MKIYVLNITSLLEEKIFQKALLCVDENRREKIQHLKVRNEQARSLGAGLLLQYALWTELETAKEKKGILKDFIQEVTVSEILQNNSLPIPFRISFKENKKPYFEQPFSKYHFNLSHSKDYAVCGIDQNELGIDLQYKRDDIKSNLASFLFTEKENKLLDHCKNEEEYKTYFYELFSSKEAYIKLTGQGLKQEFKSFEVDCEKNRIMKTDSEIVLAKIRREPFGQDYSLVIAQNETDCIP